MLIGNIEQLIRKRVEITLPDGRTITVLEFDPHCENCGAPSEAELCPPCVWLSSTDLYQARQWGYTEGMMNRRWQSFFTTGQLKGRQEQGPRWERKRKEQDW